MVIVDDELKGGTMQHHPINGLGLHLSNMLASEVADVVQESEGVDIIQHSFVAVSQPRKDIVIDHEGDLSPELF